ncbi:MAG: RNA polymerase sigma factor FliA [Deltaproteobacteria bacterium]|nr:RNA polymerase sigma factor FliA [Deltaproteobacteria bacterium]
MKSYNQLSEEQKEQLISEYLPLVKKIASRFIHKVPPSIEPRDLINAGIYGLLEAAERFDESLDVSFEAYAYHRVRGAILDYLRSCDWLPRSIRSKLHKIEKAYMLVEQKLGRQASEEEVSNELGISVEEFRELLGSVSNMVLFSFEELGFGKGEDRFWSKDESAVAPLETVLEQELVDIVARALDRLPEKEKLVTVLYFYEELNLKEISEVLNLTESRVSQLRASGLLRLKVYLRKSLGILDED